MVTSPRLCTGLSPGIVRKKTAVPGRKRDFDLQWSFLKGGADMICPRNGCGSSCLCIILSLLQQRGTMWPSQR